MNDIELNKLWKSQDEKLDQLLMINQELLKETIRNKANTTLARAKSAK
ncbi:hypothetical protein OKW21_001853 [Catalinimonas alkaloidigena]|nr:hypothetical protein [Catalinimonas alkaloidigena]MDF9796590.1 hypothetical protein [Catalinimonas alkaloidigena]